MENVGQVPMKVVWSFQIDDEFPARVDKQEIRNSQVFETYITLLKMIAFIYFSLPDLIPTVFEVM